jgi:hypothetical protein
MLARAPVYRKDLNPASEPSEYPSEECLESSEYPSEEC